MAAVKSCSHGRQGAKFESLHVQNIYNEIAPCMNNLENKAWPHVKRFLKRFPPGAVIADIGCGNGRYMDINKATFKVGIDVCCPLVDFAREKGHETLYGDNLHVPFRDCVFDGVVSIGVIHHFCSKARRVAALRELARILRPGGKLMLYVWAFEQKHRRFDGQDILIPWHEGCHREKRFGSTSSTHSSLGGLSSVSSLSEDEPSDSPRPVNQPEQSDLGGATTSSPRARASTNKILRRQGSVSLDDLMTVRELSDFKPNYYSLDFTKSPKRGIRKSNTDSYVWSNDLTNRQAQSRKDTLIQECRKLEASIRALSSGSLDLMQKTDDDLKIELRCGNSSHSLEHFDPSNTCEVKLKEMQVDDDAFEDKEDSSEYHVKTLADDLKINLDWNIGEIDDDFEDEILSNPVIIDSGYSENVQEDCDEFVISQKDSSLNALGSFARDRNGQKSYPKTRHVNPFLKQDSLDPYSFNNVSDDISEGSGSIEVIYEHYEEFSNPDQMSVNFKPETKQKEPERSFFRSVKAKLKGIFDSNDSETKERNEKLSLNLKSKIERNDKPELTKAGSKPEFSEEQIKLAQQLNFQVREFPLSSCPDVVTPDKEDMKPVEVNYGSVNQMLSRNNLNSLNKECEKFAKMSRAFARKDAKSCDIEGTYEVIYDGYMKIDVDHLSNDEDASLLNEESCALVSNRAFSQKGSHVAGQCKSICGKHCENQNDFEIVKECKREHILAKKFSQSNQNTMKPTTPNTITMASSSSSQNNMESSHPSQNTVKPCTFSQNTVKSNTSSQNTVKSSTNTQNTMESSYPSQYTVESRIPSQNSNDLTCTENGLNDDGPEMLDEMKHSGSLEQADSNISVDDSTTRLSRYYHVFKEGELHALISEEVHDLHITQCFYDHANWCIVAEKLPV